MDYHKKNDKKKVEFYHIKTQDIIITHFARTSEKNSNLFYMIYKILVTLKVYIIKEGNNLN
jgi:hypothetical protein